jgi:anaerobic magnesium-protoporphyrin IX monomethyl ester cyclase
MNILLVVPPLPSLYYTANVIFPPLALMYVASVLEQDGHDVQIRDLTIDKSPIDYSSVDIVGVTCTTPQYNAALQIAKEAHEHGKIVLMGGVHVTFTAEETLKTGYVDYVIRGEGEDTVRELCRALQEHGRRFDPMKIHGISWYDPETKSVMHSPERHAIMDINRIPYPARHLVDMKGYPSRLNNQRATTLLGSRGCPYKCVYCVVPNMNSAIYRQRSPESIVDEVEHIVDNYGVSGILFVDDNFTINIHNTMRFCEELMRRKIDILWWCQSRADTLLKHEEMVDKMAQSGCYMVFLGLESPNERVLKSYNKKLKGDEGEQVVKLLSKYGIKTMGSFMMGEIHETEEEVENTINYATHIDPTYAQFSILTPFPGTKLFAMIKDRILHFNWELFDGAHSVLRLDYLTKDQIEGLLKKAYKKFYLRASRIPFYLKNVLNPLRIKDSLRIVHRVRQLSRSYRITDRKLPFTDIPTVNSGD